jgi:putative ABC transport system ATP-binding protein
MAMIEISGISKIYRKGNINFTALNNISFKIENGDFCTITGPSGAGKSTLLCIIGGLTHPDAGSIFYNGKDIYRQSSKEIDRYRREKVGFMFQQFHLMPYLTVQENIKIACHDKHHLERADFYLVKCNLYEMRNKYPSELSVGEKQRTAFIRAIISTPKMLLADEPTGNLDPENSSILISLINEYRTSGGTVILVSHDTAISANANQNIILEKGNQIVLPASRVRL